MGAVGGCQTGLPMGCHPRVVWVLGNRIMSIEWRWTGQLGWPIDLRESAA